MKALMQPLIVISEKTFSLFNRHNIWSIHTFWVSWKYTLFSLDLWTALFSLKAFSDQRRKIKPARRHAASSNPLRQRQNREDLRTETDVSQYAIYNLHSQIYRNYMYIISGTNLGFFKGVGLVPWGFRINGASGIAEHVLNLGVVGGACKWATQVLTCRGFADI